MTPYDRAVKGMDLLHQLRERSALSRGGAATTNDLDAVLQLSPEDLHDLVVFLTQLGYIERSPQSMYGQTLYHLTPAGMHELVRAQQQHGKLTFQTGPAVQFQQTVHGTANTQVGSFNTMTVQVQSGITPADLLQHLAALQAAVQTLPEDEREEAQETLRRAEQAVKEGAFDKLKRYSGTLLDLGTKSVDFGTKAHAFLSLVGLV